MFDSLRSLFPVMSPLGSKQNRGGSVSLKVSLMICRARPAGCCLVASGKEMFFGFGDGTSALTAKGKEGIRQRDSRTAECAADRVK